MTQRNRLPQGGCVDRGRRLDFTFNGKRYTGFQGDTLASALLANGVRLVGRSFKYHRPRGIVGSGVEEPNALVQLGTGAQTLPNYVATQIELYDGLEAESVNCWPSVALRSAGRQRPHLALPSARLLLQDLHVAQVVLAPLRASAPKGRRFGCRADGARHGSVRQDERPLRRALGRVGPGWRRGRSGGRPRRSAGHPGRRAAGVRRKPAGQPPDYRDRVGRGLVGSGAGGAAHHGRGPPSPAKYGVRLLRPQLRRHTRTGHGPPRADRRLRAAAAHLEDQGKAGRPGYRRNRTPTGLPKQRPARA